MTYLALALAAYLAIGLLVALGVWLFARRADVYLDGGDMLSLVVTWPMWVAVAVRIVIAAVREES
jgi:hypothetical protein